MIAVIGDDLYNLFFVIHIMAITAAFGPAFAYSVLVRKASTEGGKTGAALASISPILNKRYSFPALITAALAGVGLIVSSEKAYTFDKPWVSASFTIVLVLALLLWFVIGPALRRLEAVLSTDANDQKSQDEVRAARVTASMATGIFHLGFLILIFLMVWKPGQ